LPELVHRGDRVLVEQPTDRYQILDLSAYDAQRASPALPHGGERGSREGQLRTTLQNIDVAVRGVQSLENEMQLFDWASPEHGNFLQFLVGEGAGIVVPIDAPSALRDAYLCDIIQYSGVQVKPPGSLAFAMQLPSEIWIFGAIGGGRKKLVTGEVAAENLDGGENFDLFLKDQAMKLRELAETYNILAEAWRLQNPRRVSILDNDDDIFYEVPRPEFPF